MRSARGAYALVIQRELTAAGFDDLPRSGPFVLGGIVNWGATVADMVSDLGVTRQAASQLIDVLVLRGYLTRQADAQDRRRIAIGLTPRGETAGGVVINAIAAVDRNLGRRITPEEFSGLRAGLQALTDLKAEHAAEIAPS